MIEILQLTKQYGDFTAVDAIDLVVPRGELFGFLGPNGAGKTTTLRMIAGILKPTAGTIRVAGVDMSADPVTAKAKLGFIPDRPFIYEKLTGAEFLRFVAGLYDQQGDEVEHRARELLALFDLEEWRDELVESYSHGMRQKLIISSAFVHRPEVIVVDEPMVGLDPKAARILKDLFREYTRRGHTIIFSTHTLEVAESLCDRLAIIVNGKIKAYGTMADLRRDLQGGERGLEEIFLRLTGENAARNLVDVLDAYVLPAPRVSGAQRTVQPLPDPALLHLLLPKWLTARARTMQGEKGRGARYAILAFTGFLFWAFIFGMLYRLLTYFRGVEEIGQLLAAKLLGLALIGFTSILLLSNVITALSSFFLAKDLDMLVAAPVDWLRLYGAKLLETIVASSWMVLLVSVPIFSAYGLVYDGGFAFPLVVVLVMIPTFIIPAVVGSAITLTLVNIFPARRTRDILSVIAVLTAGGIVLLFRMIRPEQLARPEGFRNLVDFISVLRTPTSPLMPSEWAQKVTMGFLRGEPDWLALYLLWATAAAFVVLGALLHRWLYLTGFSKAQESSQRFVTGGSGRLARFGRRLLAPFGVLRRELVLKELRLFFRDTTQWSQLILLAVLVVVYVFNIKYLPLRGEGITFFLVNVVPFLNLVLAGFVLASIAARFIFPGVSLEGRTLWLLRSSPMEVRDLLWAKFWVGTMPLLILAVAIVGVTDYLLQVSDFMFFVSVISITMLTFALAGLAIGFGTMFPQFETENAAQIPTSFGGLLYMMASVSVIGGVVILEARPVYGYLSAKAFGTAADPTEMALGFGAAALLCIAATVVPIRMALTRLEAIER